MQDLDDDLHVDLTPLIDVIFMLVIFFIMTMSFTLPVVEFNLPESSTAKAASQSATLRITVDAKGNMSVEDKTLSYPELEAYVQEQVKEQGEHLSLEVLIDAQAPTQYLIEVADLARTYTQGRMALISSKKEDLTPGGIISSHESNADTIAPTVPTQSETALPNNAATPGNLDSLPASAPASVALKD